MDKNATIIVTGAYGFIGSCLVGYLNRQGYENLILVDEFDDEEKELNLHQKKYISRIERENLSEWLAMENPDVDFVFHLGARTDTTEFDYSVHEKLNLEYSKMIWHYCVYKNIPLVYASSAATYGDGALGYSDEDDALPFQLKPLNPYGISKNEFDKWALCHPEPAEGHPEPAEGEQPPFWAGLKFFNVYGPNEYHKARMASVIFHSFNQVKENGKVKLFKSHKEGFKDGEQLRDFIYVKDVVSVCNWLMENMASLKDRSGLYNLGTGQARSFNDLVKATFAAMDKDPVIEYIDMPDDIRDKYQYFTEASMKKLTAAGYDKAFYSLEKGVDDYVRNYLALKNFY